MEGGGRKAEGGRRKAEGGRRKGLGVFPGLVLVALVANWCQGIFSLLTLLAASVEVSALSLAERRLGVASALPGWAPWGERSVRLGKRRHLAAWGKGDPGRREVIASCRETARGERRNRTLQ